MKNMRMQKNQRGYMQLSGIGSAITFVACCVFAAGVLVGVMGTTGIPWLWGLFKPWLHQITG